MPWEACGEFKFKIIESSLRSSIDLADIQTLEESSTPAWIYSHEMAKIAWSNSKAKETYGLLVVPALEGLNNTEINLDTDAEILIKLFEKVENEDITVHIIGMRRLLIEGTKKDNDEIVTLVVSPIKIKSMGKATLFQEAEILEEDDNDNKLPLDSPLDIVMRMLNLLAQGLPIPPIHAIKLRNALQSGHDIHTPLVFTMKDTPVEKDNISMLKALGFELPDMENKTLPLIEYKQTFYDEGKVQKYIAKNMFNTWEFDGFKFFEETNGHPLYALTMHIFDTTEVVDILNVNKTKLHAFVLKVEEGYSMFNEYHNASHAASVLYCMHMIISTFQEKSIFKNTNKIFDVIGNAKIRLAAYIAAIIHDYCHNALSNSFLIQALDPLAVLYNDISPQEQHHSASAFKLLLEPEYNFMENFDKNSFQEIRKMVITMVIKTDMQNHFAVLTQFRTRASAKPLWHSNTTDIAMVLQVILKMSDLSHCTYDFSLHKKWVCSLQEEMFRQGDKEKQLGFPVSELMDRNKTGIYKSQAGFFEFAVTDLFTAVSKEFTNTEPLLRGVLHNYNKWKTGECV